MTVIAVNFRRRAPKYSFLNAAQLAGYEDGNRELLAQLKTLQAGRNEPHPLRAASLRPLLDVKEGGLTLREALTDALENRFRDNTELLRPWGLVPVATPMCWYGVDLTPASAAAPALAKAFGPHWRHVVAADAAAINIDVSPRPLVVTKAVAVFKVSRSLRADWDRGC